MTNLVGAGVFCNSGVGIKEPASGVGKLQAYPNPFSTYITVPSESKEEDYLLTDYLGQIIYTGKEIEKVNLSGLRSGMYILRALHGVRPAALLVKE